jgi:hypothetical protein
MVSVALVNSRVFPLVTTSIMIPNHQIYDACHQFTISQTFYRCKPQVRWTRCAIRGEVLTMVERLIHPSKVVEVDSARVRPPRFV